MGFVTAPEPITQRDMLMAWAVAEIDSKKPLSLGAMFAGNPGADAAPTRCAAMITLHDGGKHADATTDVILGVHPDVPTWSQW